MRASLHLTPRGHLHLEADDGPAKLREAFARGDGHGLLWLGSARFGDALPPALSWWRSLGGAYVTALCGLPSLGGPPALPAPPPGALARMAEAPPEMLGAEYLSAALLERLWGAMHEALLVELAEAGGSLQDFLKARDPAWNTVGRVHVHLAENRKDPEAPFAFLATYTSGRGASGQPRHLPLGRALQEYAADRDRLLGLLLPLQRAAERVAWLKRMVDKGEIFHPLRWSPRQAMRLLGDVHELEAAGLVVRMPAQWKARRPPRPKVTASVGGRPPSKLGTDALLDFQVSVTLEGEPLTAEEVATILASTSGLVLLRGQWVEVDSERVAQTLGVFQQAAALARRGGLSFAEALRLLAGADVRRDEVAEGADPDWSQVVAGPWLAQTLAGLRSPSGLAQVAPGPGFQARLRPYQEVGLRWLHLLSQLGLGACLADDMGLGKTIQVLALLSTPGAQGPSLLAAPASLLANWASEIERFAPSLRVLVAHASVTPAEQLKATTAAEAAALDLVIVSYGGLRGLGWLTEVSWRRVILDEAQAIKNPRARQTRAARALRAHSRIALTGTPVENHLGDLWSIFDFLNPGLLGSASEFSAYTKRIAGRPGNPYAPLRQLVRPYLLRRLKTDKAVIADLPDKTEVIAWCPLSRKQAALYAKAVGELAGQLREVEGMQRRGAVLAALTRLKQICNHPSQWLDDGDWAEGDSGKWGRLRELAETIAARQEKALIFTQFTSIIPALQGFLAQVFGRQGLVLHGGTPVGKRRALVTQFQEDEATPFFILSLKAGGSRLNLTAASHVIHFDRWWNPAVENQATDRAFRIGQTRNVMVHKFVCRGTVEEKINELISSKRQLSEQLLSGGGEIKLTELSDNELLDLVSLDLRAAMKE